MKVLADEGVDAAIVARLRSDGHDVEYVAELAPGITDDEVLDRAASANQLLMTADKDFGELVFRLDRAAFGVVLLRLPGLAPTVKADLVSQAVHDHGDEMPAAFTVVAPGLVRIRPPL